jgi:hypothetical protein
MGRRSAQKFNKVSIIPDDLHLFEVADIPRHFEYLSITFHLSSRWENHFKESLLKVEKGKSDQEYFFEFMKENLETPLKIILQREEVVFAIARYLIKDRIQEKQREQNHMRIFYRSDEWKK